MAITRTARGTGSKLLGSDLLEFDVTANQGDNILVCVAYPHIAGPPDGFVRWGLRDMSVRASGTNAGSKGLTNYLIRGVQVGGTKPFKAKWRENVGDAVAIAITMNVGQPDVRTSGSQDASTFTATGYTANAITTDEELAVSFHVSNGNSADAFGTPVDDFLAGQRVSTANIDMREIYKDMTGSALATVRGRLNAVAARDWTSTIMTFQAAQFIKLETAGGDEFLTEAELGTVQAEMESLINTNWTALNNTLPASAQTNLSNQQKMDMFCYALKHFSVPTKA